MNERYLSNDNSPARENLVFTLGNEEYGINILKVQEIRGYDTVTRIANSPPYLKGVINLRGAIVPIVDLRIKFGLQNVTYTPFTVVIILNVGQKIVGIVVDSVSDVIHLDPEQCRPAPELGGVVNTDYVLGLGVIENRMVILTDIEKLMTSHELALFEQLSLET